MATIKDVAETAQVSISTVSHVVNGTRFVSKDLRLRVENAMQQLGYRPNALARSLRRGRTGTIGLVIPDNANLFFAEIAREIEELGFQNGYSVILCNTDDDPQKEIAYTTTLLEKKVDGIIFISAGGSEEILLRVLKAHMPVVLVDREARVDTDMILLDHVAGGFLAGQYLVRLGHRRLACISGAIQLPPSSQRVEGFLAALHEARVPFDMNNLVSGDFRYISGERCMDQLLNQGPTRPTAVFACNDLMAIGAIRSAHSHGLNVPQDISIIGFDDIPLAQAISPALTTIAQPVAELAKRPVEFLIKQIQARENNSNNTVTQRIILAPKLVERDSCIHWSK